MTAHLSPLIVVLVLPVLVLGCYTTSSAIRTGEGAFPATTPAEVAVFLQPEDVKRPYQEIGVVSAERRAKTTWTDVNEGKVIDLLKKKAASIGAHGIILESITQQDKTSASFGGMWNTEGGFQGGGVNSIDKKTARARAIRYTS